MLEHVFIVPLILVLAAFGSFLVLRGLGRCIKVWTRKEPLKSPAFKWGSPRWHSNHDPNHQEAQTSGNRATEIHTSLNSEHSPLLPRALYTPSFVRPFRRWGLFDCKERGRVMSPLELTTFLRGNRAGSKDKPLKPDGIECWIDFSSQK